MSIRGDVGPQVLDDAFQKMMIDKEWSVREDRSFTWWGTDSLNGCGPNPSGRIQFRGHDPEAYEEQVKANALADLFLTLVKTH